MRNIIERRRASGRVELRAKAKPDDQAGISGYGAVFNSETVIGPWFRETIKPGAFANVIGGEADVRSLFNHDPNWLLGRSTAGTLRLAEDETGLRYDVDINDADPMAVSVAARIARRDCTGSSFGFRVKREEWVEPDEGSTDLPLRIIHEFAELADVGPVTFPAYTDTTAEGRDAVRAALASATMPASVRSSLEAQLETRSVPKNVSTKKAPTDTPWSAPSLTDFTQKTWDELTPKERTRIAGHFAWKDGDTYGDLHLPHHRPADGAIVLRGVVSAAGRIDQLQGGDKAAIRAHIEAHYHAFGLKAPWEADASSQRDVDAALARQEAGDGEEAAELVQYQTLAGMLEQAGVTLGSAQTIVRELIAAEAETPTDGADEEAAEEAVECARFTSLLALCQQLCGTLTGVAALAQDLLNEHEADEEPAADGGMGADEGAAAQNDGDRHRRLQYEAARASQSLSGANR